MRKNLNKIYIGLFQVFTLIFTYIFFDSYMKGLVWKNLCTILRPLKVIIRKKIYNLFQLSSAVLMMLALMWLTVSTPFVYKCQQRLAQHAKSSSATSPMDVNEDETNPFGNNTEEKAPGGGINTLSEEYLHDHHNAEYLLSIARQYHKNEDAGIYIAFHGELLVPPPNAA